MKEYLVGNRFLPNTIQKYAHRKGGRAIIRFLAAIPRCSVHPVRFSGRPAPNVSRDRNGLRQGGQKNRVQRLPALHPTLSALRSQG